MRQIKGTKPNLSKEQEERLALLKDGNEKLGKVFNALLKKEITLEEAKAQVKTKV